MDNSFKNVKNNMFTRNFGGGDKNLIADPYITGYHHIWFDSIPKRLKDYIKQERADLSEFFGDTIGNVSSVLAATCTGVTPPGGTLNRVEFTGLGGTKWAVPGNVDYGNSVSLKFIEMNRTPILGIMHSWVKMIRDYRMGITNILDDETNIFQSSSKLYTKDNYSAILYYWTTAPDGATIEYYACYDGVFPLKDPQDLYSSDIETIGRLDVEIEFSLDYIHHEPWVKSKCEAFAENYNKLNDARNNLIGMKYE